MRVHDISYLHNKKNPITFATVFSIYTKITKGNPLFVVEMTGVGCIFHGKLGKKRYT